MPFQIARQIKQIQSISAFSISHIQTNQQVNVSKWNDPLITCAASWCWKWNRRRERKLQLIKEENVGLGLGRRTEKRIKSMIQNGFRIGLGLGRRTENRTSGSDSDSDSEEDAGIRSHRKHGNGVALLSPEWTHQKMEITSRTMLITPLELTRKWKSPSPEWTRKWKAHENSRSPQKGMIRNLNTEGRRRQRLADSPEWTRRRLNEIWTEGRSRDSRKRQAWRLILKGIGFMLMLTEGCLGTAGTKYYIM